MQSYSVLIVQIPYTQSGLIRNDGTLTKAAILWEEQCSNENEQYDPPEIRVVRIIGPVGYRNLRVYHYENKFTKLV